MVLALSASFARADVIIDFVNTSLTPGSSGHIDVMIRSSNGTDRLGRFAAKFELSHISGTGVLEFQSTANQRNSERTDASYVFFGNTATTGFAAIRNSNDRGILTQGDRTLSNSTNVTLSTSPLLLARLEMEHITPVYAAGQYSIRLVNDSSTFFRLSDNSTAVTVSSDSFSNSGLITVVPEPSMAVFIFGSMGIVFLRRGRRC